MRRILCSVWPWESTCLKKQLDLVQRVYFEQKDTDLNLRCDNFYMYPETTSRGEYHEILNKYFDSNANFHKY